MTTNKLFFRIGNMNTNIEEVEYKSVIMDIFQIQCNITVNPDQIKLVENRDGDYKYKTFSFVTLENEDDIRVAISILDGFATEEGFQLAVSQAQDKPRDNNSDRGGFNKGFNKPRR